MIISIRQFDMRLGMMQKIGAVFDRAVREGWKYLGEAVARGQRLAFLLLVLGILWVSRGNANPQKTASPSSVTQHVLYLNGTNTGQHVSATVGQPIEITLRTVGPGQYRSPQISSPAVRFESVAFPKDQIPAGPTQVYRFRAASEGEAQLEIPHQVRVNIAHGARAQASRDPNPAFAVTTWVYQRQKP